MMLRDVRVHDSFFARRCFNGGEDEGFFAPVVRLETNVERVGVREKGAVFGGGDEGCVVVDGVKGADDAVVDTGHFGGGVGVLVGLWGRGFSWWSGEKEAGE